MLSLQLRLAVGLAVVPRTTASQSILAMSVSKCYTMATAIPGFTDISLTDLISLLFVGLISLMFY